MTLRGEVASAALVLVVGAALAATRFGLDALPDLAELREHVRATPRVYAVSAPELAQACAAQNPPVIVNALDGSALGTHTTVLTLPPDGVDALVVAHWSEFVDREVVVVARDSVTGRGIAADLVAATGARRVAVLRGGREACAPAGFRITDVDVDPTRPPVASEPPR